MPKVSMYETVGNGKVRKAISGKFKIGGRKSNLFGEQMKTDELMKLVGKEDYKRDRQIIEQILASRGQKL